MQKKTLVKRAIEMYAEGFGTLSPWARTLWIIILLKLFIMFAIFKLFFFRDTLQNRFNSTEERAAFVIDQITNNK
jgi:hypothetical protein